MPGILYLYAVIYLAKDQRKARRFHGGLYRGQRIDAYHSPNSLQSGHIMDLYLTCLLLTGSIEEKEIVLNYLNHPL